MKKFLLAAGLTLAATAGLSAASPKVSIQAVRGNGFDTTFSWEMLQMTEDSSGYTFYFQCDESQVAQPGHQLWVVVNDDEGERSYGVRAKENPVKFNEDLILEYSAVANPFYFEEPWNGQVYVTLLKDNFDTLTAFFTNEQVDGGYLPMIEQGKTWEYEGTYRRTVDEQTESGLVNHFMKFDGTVTVNDKEYSTFRLYRSDYYRNSTDGGDRVLTESLERNEPVYYMREEDRRVFVLTKGDYIYSTGEGNPALEGTVTGEEYGEFLRYDFSLASGSEFSLPSGSCVAEDELIPVVAVKGDAVEVGGKPCISYSYYKPESYGTSYWRPAYGGRVISGVGPTQDGDLAVFGPPYTASMPNDVYAPGQGSELVRVYASDGTVIYGDAPNGVETITVAYEQDTTIYDVMGRVVRDMVPGSIYIRAGKKFVAK